MGVGVLDLKSARDVCGNHGISHLEFHWPWPASKRELLSVLRSKPLFQNWPGNQVESNSANRALRRGRAFAARKLSIGHLCKSPIPFPSSSFPSLTSSWKTWFLVHLHRSRPWAYLSWTRCLPFGSPDRTDSELDKLHNTPILIDLNCDV